MYYEWKYGPAVVTAMDNLSNVVILINWTCLGYSASGGTFKDTGEATTPPLDPVNFVPFDQLTKEQIETWVFAVVNKTQIENKLLQQSVATPDVLPFDF